MSGLFFDNTGIQLSQIYNKKTLNIFCDASIIKRNNITTGCYGVVAVCMDDIIDSIYKQVSNTTSNNSEVKGLRAALSLANKYKYNFPIINIFSDSQISVFGLRDYIYNWKYNIHDGLLYGSADKPIKNQEIFIECYHLMNTIKHAKLNIFHQSGHIDNKYENIKKASMVFSRSNNIHGTVDLNLIRYISTYNNYVDQTSRSLLRRSNLSLLYEDPILFVSKGKISRQ